MVEVALSIAVVAFALVAIIGVLPTGLTVQRDNREDTIVNQDGTYFLEAIKDGQYWLKLMKAMHAGNTSSDVLRANELANYVDFISVRTNDRPPLVLSNTLTGYRIIGLLSTPKYVGAPGLPNTITNIVTAQIRAMAGSAVEKPPADPELAFRYQLTSEIVPLLAVPPVLTNVLSSNQVAQLACLRSNAYEVRLTVRWPLLPKGEIGARSRVFRTVVAGESLPVEADDEPAPLHFFWPSTFRAATLP